jgi:hypothetical protein
MVNGVEQHLKRSNAQREYVTPDIGLSDFVRSTKSEAKHMTTSDFSRNRETDLDVDEQEPVIVHLGKKLALDRIAGCRSDYGINPAFRAKGRLAVMNPIFNFAPRTSRQWKHPQRLPMSVTR